MSNLTKKERKINSIKTKFLNLYNEIDDLEGEIALLELELIELEEN